jgi:hypothetical protein
MLIVTVVFGIVSVTHLYSFLCCVFVLFVVVLCLVPNVASVSRLFILDYHFGFL